MSQRDIPPLPKGMEWLDDPKIVDPKEWLRRMAEADPKPGDKMKRARSNLSYFLKTRRYALVHPSSPIGHVFTDVFFPWLLKKYPFIQGIHPHYGYTLLTNSVSVSWSDAKKPEPAPSPLDVLQKENEQLKAKIATLEEDIRKFREKEEFRKATNRANARRPRNPQ